LIAPIASSSAPITPSRPTSSATATTPHADVSDASPECRSEPRPPTQVSCSPNGCLPATDDSGPQQAQSSLLARHPFTTPRGVAFLPADPGLRPQDTGCPQCRSCADI
jgi:hypothetical protein